ncbi:hypothetical protein T484DRAFT_1968231 [Baffinella frigidus]|nr:hypothetical protein T484DRAFT_1968231 [Cryptophyta sp. CCMP2293]
MRYGMTNRTGRGANKAIRLLLEDQLLQSFFSREGEFLASRRPSLKYPFLNGGRAEGGAPSHPWITSRRTSVVHAPAPFPTHPSHPAAHPVSADAFLPSSARRSPGFVRSLSMATPGRVPEDAAADLSKVVRVPPTSHQKRAKSG